MKSLLLLAVVAVLCSCPLAFGFSRQGHETIALLAYSSPKLTSTAKVAIDKILDGESIDFSAEWPDAIKPPFGTLASTAEGKKFNHDHGENRHWHFINFPIGSTSYSQSSPYAQPTDIAHAIKGCITVLEGTGSFDNLTKREALRYLVHLVGDVHQPLHTAFEIWNVSDPQHPKMLPPSPTAPAGTLYDGGGNDLFYTAKKELHADWDDDLVEAIVPSGDTAKLVNALKGEVSATKYKAHGDYHNWVDSWLGDSMKLVPGVFAGIQYGEYIEEKDAQGHIKARKIMITLPANYKSVHVKDARAQVVKGASHLLQLFNAMHWAPN